MKTIRIIALAIMAAAMSVACNSTNNDPKVDAQLPSKAEVDSVSYLVGFNFGYFIKQNGFENLNKAEIEKGMNDFINAEKGTNDPDFAKQFKISPDVMNQVFDNYLSKINNYKGAVNDAKGKEFLEANKAKEGIQVTESGLQYKIIEAGNEVKPAADAVVKVNYRGTLIDGTEFDSNAAASGPVSINLAQVIPGWREGLQLIGEGGKIQLFIPAELAYGDRGPAQIGPKSTLIFDIDLVSVDKIEETPAE